MKQPVSLTHILAGLLLLMACSGESFGLFDRGGDAADSTAVSPASGDADRQAAGDTAAADGLAASADSPADSLSVPPADPVAVALESLAREIVSLRATVDSMGTAADTVATATELRNQLRSTGMKVLLSLIFLVLWAVLIRMGSFVLETLSERSAARRMLFKRLVPIVRIGLWTLGIYIALDSIIGVTAQGIVAAGAAVSVAVGFAAQDVLKNVLGGLIVLFDQPFQVGDKIEVEGTYGEVVSIGLRSTKLVTPDDNLVTVPNAQVVDGQVANANAGELNCQVVTDLYLPGWVDEAVAKSLAHEAAVSSEYVYLNKPVVVLVKDVFKETFLLRVRVKAYVLDPRYEFLFQSDVTERARNAFREEGLLPEDHRFGEARHNGAEASSTRSEEGR